MTDDTTNDATSDEPPAFAFELIPVAELATAAKGADPESIALGTAVLAAVTVEQAAGDPLRFDDRKAAVNRVAVIKRAVRAAGGAPAGHKIATKIRATASGYQVAIILAVIPADAPKRGAKTAN